jgi:hypothetical protein
LLEVRQIYFSSMLPKFFASWLVVLVLMPFTAPFSTCDPVGFFGTQGQSLPFSPQTSAAVTHDTAVPSVPCISTAGRVTLSPLSGLPLTQTKISATATRFMWSGASAGYIREHTVLTTILRL